VCERLLAADWQVLGVSRAPQPETAGMRWLQADLGSVLSAPQAVDAVISCGPLDLFARWYAESDQACARVVAFGSTSAVVKQDSSDPAERRLAQLLDDSEAMVMAAAAKRGAAATLLRPTLIYGAGRDQTLTRIAEVARRAHFFLLPRDANGLRQPVHVQDLADAAVLAIDASASHGHSYALPGGETLPYAQIVERVLASLQPPVRLVQVPGPVFSAVLAAARWLGKMHGLGDAAVARMRDDLVFDAAPAQRDFGYAPRKFEPTQDMFLPLP
jgi:nucleoside-diphosphate-sugar epimerase